MAIKLRTIVVFKERDKKLLRSFLVPCILILVPSANTNLIEN